MSNTSKSPILAAAAGALLACLLLAGCAAAPAAPRSALQFVFQSTPASFRADASATVEATFTYAPEIRGMWRGWGSKDPWIEAYQQAVATALKDDVAKSGLFARIVEPGLGQPDYLVKIQAEEYNLSDLRLRMTIRLLDAATGAELFARNAEVPLGVSCAGPGKRYALTPLRPPSFPPDLPGSAYSGRHLMTGSLQIAAQQLMPVMKAGVAGYFQKAADQTVLGKMQAASLSELIAGSDRSVSLARERNRLIIAAKNQQLPAMLRERKTAELTNVVISIEQAIMDLDHESEVAKDRAQQAMANNGNAGQIDELRGFAISYRERIELLKPILSALKEEIANRSR